MSNDLDLKLRISQDGVETTAGQRLGCAGVMIPGAHTLGAVRRMKRI